MRVIALNKQCQKKDDRVEMNAMLDIKAAKLVFDQMLAKSHRAPRHTPYCEHGEQRGFFCCAFCGSVWLGVALFMASGTLGKLIP